VFFLIFCNKQYSLRIPQKHIKYNRTTSVVKINLKGLVMVISCLSNTHSTWRKTLKNSDVCFVQRTNWYSKTIKILKTDLNLSSSLLANDQSTFLILSLKILNHYITNEQFKKLLHFNCLRSYILILYFAAQTIYWSLYLFMR